MSSSTTQEATKFGVKIRIKEKEVFRPGMSVTAEIETRSRSNALTVPIASVTTRVPKDKSKNGKKVLVDPPGTISAAAKTNPLPASTNAPGSDKKKEAKPIEVVFVVEGDHVKMVPVKIGISDDNYWEITDGLTEGQDVVSAGYKAISRELEDGKRIRKGAVIPDSDREKTKPE